ncbi:Hemin transport system permease protein HmuU [Ensifer sp. M14]|uniref:FecCD family ABC transporter permease n=1 Tax=Ensifer sp. M14 TaxID=2203782 RepID=UPI000E1DEB06|nr:iron ABC transporter permease [Ensifer sp. M14]RDL47634.1 Hemin transport system permease protein HmuU [Ensifer sp. M14]
MTDAALQLDILRSHYRREVFIRLSALGVAVAGLVFLMLVDLAKGPSGMPLGDVWATLLAGPHSGDQMATTILWQLRMPQTIMGVLVGACLGIGGLQMQTILCNPLASPFTLGFSAAAGFGAALAIMFGSFLPLPGFVLVPASAFFMTLLACALVYFVAALRGTTPEILVLAGIAVLFLFQSLQSLLQFMASPEVLQQIVFWLFGSLLKASWTTVSVTAVILAVCLPFVIRDSWRLTLLRLGDVNASSLGLSVDCLRRRSFVLVSLLTAAAVCFVGTIGFVGLIAPHVARAAVGEDHRFAVPMAATAGAIILLGASVFAKLISPAAVIPVGIITAIAGIPMLIVVIARRGKGERP